MAKITPTAKKQLLIISSTTRWQAASVDAACRRRLVSCRTFSRHTGRLSNDKYDPPLIQTACLDLCYLLGRYPLQAVCETESHAMWHRALKLWGGEQKNRDIIHSQCSIGSMAVDCMIPKAPDGFAHLQRPDAATMSWLEYLNIDIWRTGKPLYIILAGFPALLGFPPSPSPPLPTPYLWLPGFTRDICKVIAQDNCIPDIVFKTLCWKYVPQNSPFWIGGVRGYKMNRFSRQFMKFPKLLMTFRSLKFPPPVGLGVKFFIDFLGSSWHFPDFFELLTP